MPGKSKSGWSLLILKIRLTETGHIKRVLFSFSSSWNHDEEIILVKDKTYSLRKKGI